MTRKPCRNSRYVGDPRTITLPDGHVVAEGGRRLDFGNYDPDDFGTRKKPAAMPKAVVKALPAPVAPSMPSLPVIVPPPAVAPFPLIITPPAVPPAPRTIASVTAEIMRLLEEGK
jgi:hypothetical protein